MIKEKKLEELHNRRMIAFLNDSEFNESVELEKINRLFNKKGTKDSVPNNRVCRKDNKLILLLTIFSAIILFPLMILIGILFILY